MRGLEAARPLTARRQVAAAGLPSTSSIPLSARRIPRFRNAALGDAAQYYAEAGDADRAVALLDRIAAEAPETILPDHVRARLRELRIRQGASAAP